MEFNRKYFDNILNLNILNSRKTTHQHRYNIKVNIEKKTITPHQRAVKLMAGMQNSV
jgi:hypothetical protein